MTSGTGTPGHIGADPRLHGFAPRAGVLPASQPPSRLRLSPTGTLPGRRHPQRPAACRRDGWHPGEDLHRSPHLPCAPHPMSPPGPPGIAPAAASPSPSCRSPSWLGDPAWGQPSGWGGLRAKLSPPNPRAPRRGAWPGERAPFPVPAVLWPALGCSVPRSAGGCSTFAALSHRRPAAAASSPAPAEKGSRSFPPLSLQPPDPQAEGQGEGPGAPAGSALSPHILGLWPFAPGEDAGRALPTRFLSPVNLFTGVLDGFQHGKGSRAQAGGFLQPAGKSRRGDEAWPGPLPAGGRWPRHAKHHAPGHPCPRSSCHINGSMYWQWWQALHRTA